MSGAPIHPVASAMAATFRRHADRLEAEARSLVAEVEKDGHVHRIVASEARVKIRTAELLAGCADDAEAIGALPIGGKP